MKIVTECHPLLFCTGEREEKEKRKRNALFYTIDIVSN